MELVVTRRYEAALLTGKGVAYGEYGEKIQINYSIFTIIYNFQVKEQWEELNRKRK